MAFLCQWYCFCFCFCLCQVIVLSGERHHVTAEKWVLRIVITPAQEYEFLLIQTRIQCPNSWVNIAPPKTGQFSAENCSDIFSPQRCRIRCTSFTLIGIHSHWLLLILKCCQEGRICPDLSWAVALLHVVQSGVILPVWGLRGEQKESVSGECH